MTDLKFGEYMVLPGMFSGPVRRLCSRRIFMLMIEP